MKLYTEEQVKSMLDRARLHKQDDSEMFSNEYLLSAETPIELPSDEEITKEWDEVRLEQHYIDGAIDDCKWFKEKILNQNK